MLTYIKDTISQITGMIAKAVVARIRDPLIRRATMTPYSHLDDYMLRYWLVPYAQANKKPEQRETGCGPVALTQRPIAWLLQKLGIAIRVHCILRGDDDRAYHDHPWNFVSVILDGVYWEHRPAYDLGLFSGETATRYEAGSVIFRRAADLHRLDVPDGQIVWTLFITGPWKQNWGFVADPGFKKHWKEYLHPEKATVPAQTIEATAMSAAQVLFAAPAEGQRDSWLMARCKECNGITHASRWRLPQEAGPMVKEHGRLEAEGRYPFTGTYSSSMGWCKCVMGDDGHAIAHRVLGRDD